MFSRKYWLLSDSEYQQLKKAGQPVPPEITLNQLQSEFMNQRMQDRIQEENNWSKLGEKIRPLIQAQTAPPPLNPSIEQSLSSTVTQMPLKTLLPAQPTADLNLPSFQPESDGETDGLPENQTVPVIKRILKEVPAKFRKKVEALYDRLTRDSRFKIDEDYVTADGVQCQGRTSSLLLNLCKNNRNTKYNDPHLYEVLKTIPDIRDFVFNERALELINREDSSRRESLADLEKFSRERGFPMDENYMDELFSSQQKKGSGKNKTGNNRLKWESMF